MTQEEYAVFSENLKFEQAMREQVSGASFLKEFTDGGFKYPDTHINLAWLAWQTRAKQC